MYKAGSMRVLTLKRNGLRGVLNLCIINVLRIEMLKVGIKAKNSVKSCHCIEK